MFLYHNESFNTLFYKFKDLTLLSYVKKFANIEYPADASIALCGRANVKVTTVMSARLAVEDSSAMRQPLQFKLRP